MILSIPPCQGFLTEIILSNKPPGGMGVEPSLVLSRQMIDAAASIICAIFSGGENRRPFPHLSIERKYPAASALPMTPATFGPMACMSR